MKFRWNGWRIENLTPHYRDKVSEAWKLKWAEEILKIEQAAPGKFNAYGFIQKYHTYPPEAIHETLKLMGRNIRNINNPWPYAVRSLVEFKGPKANINRAEKMQEALKRETGLTSASEGARALFRKLAGVDEGEGDVDGA